MDNKSEVPDNVTPERLEAARKKVMESERSKPVYNVEDLKSMSESMTWIITALRSYQDLTLLLTLKVKASKSAEIPCEDLKKELDEARARREELEKLISPTWKFFRDLENKKNAISVKTSRLNHVTKPVDALSQNTWNQGPIDRKKEYNINVGKKGEKEIVIPFIIDMTEIQEQFPRLKELNHIDERIWTISDALFRDGQDIVTFNQMYKYIGHGANSKGHKAANTINDAYTKLNAVISFDNQAEIDAGYEYKHFRYTGPILANERIETGERETIFINGQPVESVIHLLNKSRLMDFAIDRRGTGQNGQCATVPIEVYQTPLQLTEDNAKLEDYILTWLLRGLNSDDAGQVRRMNTLYRLFGISGGGDANRQRRSRLRKNVKSLLDYYKSLNLTIHGRQLANYEIDNSTAAELLKLKFKRARR